MKESLDLENNKSKSNFHIFSTTLGFFKYYTLNSFKSLSKKVYSFNPFLSRKINQKQNNSNKDININLNFENENTINIFNKGNFDNITEKELLIYNTFQIKKNIYIYLESELKINNTKIELKNSNNNNQLMQINKYKELKTKTLIYFFTSIIIEKYYNIISITSLCIISLMRKLNTYSTKSHIKLILDNLWEISNKTSKNIFASISQIISNYTENIPLNEKYNPDSLDLLVNKIQNEIRDKCNFFIHIIKEIKNEIKNIEEQFYDSDLINLKNNMMLEYKLRFFYIFCDIIFSDFFYTSFVQSYENEIFKQIEEIKKNFEDKKEKTLLAIILDIDSFKNKQFVVNEENKENDSISFKKNKDEILMNYQNCLQSIFI